MGLCISRMNMCQGNFDCNGTNLNRLELSDFTLTFNHCYYDILTKICLSYFLNLKKINICKEEEIKEFTAQTYESENNQLDRILRIFFKNAIIKILKIQKVYRRYLYEIKRNYKISEYDLFSHGNLSGKNMPQ